MLDDLITRSILKDLAGNAIFRRGDEYFSTDAVGSLRVTETKVTAKVEGSEMYKVELRDDDGDLTCDCTCLHAADGNFCKHVVAVGLAWLAKDSAVPKSIPASGKKKRSDPWRDIKDYLSKQSNEVLIELLMDVARRDDRLYQLLLLKSERVTGGASMVAAYRRAIDGVIPDGFVHWREVRDVAENIDQTVDSLAELLKPDTASVLVELAEYAIEQVENCLEDIDDSNGEIGSIVQRLGELHLKACKMARPDTARLADRL